MTTDITRADSEHLLDEGRSTPLEAGVRGTIRGFIETLLEEELDLSRRDLEVDGVARVAADQGRLGELEQARS
jgi:hypothetical protein